MRRGLAGSYFLGGKFDDDAAFSLTKRYPAPMSSRTALKRLGTSLHPGLPAFRWRTAKPPTCDLALWTLPYGSGQLQGDGLG